MSRHTRCFDELRAWFVKVKVRGCAALSLTALGCAARPAPCPDVAEPAASPAPVQALAEGVPRARPFGTVYAITFGDQEIVVNPEDGARTVAFSLAGKNVVRERKDSPDAYGSSFWTSPQSDWTWPPPYELAGAPWETRVEGTSLVLTSKVSPKLQVDVVQRVTVDAKRRAVTFDYTIQNRGSAPRKLAPWQNTRVAPGGLTLYPSAGPLSAESTLHYDTTGEIAFFKHERVPLATGIKAFADGSEGWLAHVDGDLVLIKVFPDVPKEQQAPGEAEIELYVDGEGRFVEVEQQGAYTELPAGGSVRWVVTWFLRKLPPSIEARAGSKELVAFIRDAIR